MRAQELIRQSFEICLKRRADFGALFYEDFFLRHPEVAHLFKGHTANQEKMLTEVLLSIIDKLDDAPWLSETLHQLGARHSGYQVTPQMFDWFWDSLVVTLRRISGNHWTSETEETWRDAFEKIRDAMIEGQSLNR